MQFLPVEQAPNSKSFHFAWTFRPDTLSDQCLKKGMIQPAPETAETWNMSDPMQAPNGEVSLYFTRKIPPKAKSLNWKPQEKIYLRLTNLAASGSQGSRGTRVQLKTDQLCFSGATQPLQLIRQTHLNVINHQGKQDCPLQVAVVGDASILNDDKTANTLTLRLSNTHHYDPVNPEAYALRFKGNKDATKRSKIILQFPTGPITDPWALLTMDDWEKVEITEPSGWKHKDNTSFEIYPNDEVT